MRRTRRARRPRETTGPLTAWEEAQLSRHIRGLGLGHTDTEAIVREGNVFIATLPGRGPRK